VCVGRRGGGGRIGYRTLLLKTILTGLKKRWHLSKDPKRRGYKSYECVKNHAKQRKVQRPEAGETLFVLFRAFPSVFVHNATSSTGLAWNEVFPNFPHLHTTVIIFIVFLYHLDYYLIRFIFN
jgi:hypothetical protein